jgi:MFS family permease
MTTNDVPAPPPRQRSRALVGFVATVLLTSFVAATYGFGFYLFSQIVPDMRADIGFDYTTVGTITAAGQLGFLLFALFGTWLSGRVGGIQVVIGSVALCGLCLLAVPLTDNITIITVLLGITGGTAASAYVPLVEIVGRVIDYRHRGKVLGLISSGTSYGVFVNSLLVPSFVGGGNWRGLWFVVGTATLMVTVVAALTFWRLGLFRPVNAGPDGHAETDGKSETGRRAPVPGLRTVLVGWVLVVWGMKFLNGFASMPYQNYLSPYLREELGFTVDYAAAVWGTIGVIGMVSGFVVGWMSDRTGVRKALLFSYSCFFVSAMILVVAPVGYLPLLSGALFAVAFYPIYGLLPAYVSKTASGAAATLVFGIANVTQGIGGIAGNYLAGIIASTTGSFLWFYVVIAAGTVVLGFLTTRLPPEGSPEARIGPTTSQLVTSRSNE